MFYLNEQRRLKPLEFLHVFNSWCGDLADPDQPDDAKSFASKDGVGGWVEGSYNAKINSVDNCDFVIWDEDLWLEAIAGSDAFMNTKADSSIWQRNNQVWHSKVHFIIMADECEIHGLRNPSALIFMQALTCVNPDDGRRGSMFYNAFSSLDKTDGSGVIIRFLPPLWEGEEIRFTFHAQVYAAMKFMALPIAQTVSALDRAERRRIEQYAKRDRKKAPNIVTVTLRHELIKHVQATSARKVAPDFQFRVRGHWRKYATRNEGVPVYIDPYFKGNKDMPVRVAPTKVYRVKK